MSTPKAPATGLVARRKLRPRTRRRRRSIAIATGQTKGGPFGRLFFAALELTYVGHAICGGRDPKTTALVDRSDNLRQKKRRGCVHMNKTILIAAAALLALGGQVLAA